MLRQTVIYYIHRHNSNEAYLQQSDTFVPEVSSRLYNPPPTSADMSIMAL